MQIAQKIRWWKSLQNIQDPLLSYQSNKHRKTIQKSLEILKNSPYHFEIEALTPPLLELFWLLYQDFIQKKTNGHLFPLKETIQANAKEYPYRLISFYKNTEFLGGTIFSDYHDHFRIAYKVEPHQIDVKIPGSIGMLSEYHLCAFAIQNQHQKVCAGKDRNAYGLLGANPSLALFKFKTNYLPYIVPAAELDLITCDLPLANAQDVLIFHGTTPEQKISQATLALYKTTVADAKNTYGALFKTELQIELLDKTLTLPSPHRGEEKGLGPSQ